MKRSITLRLPLAAPALSAPLLLLMALPALGQNAASGTRADIQQARADAAASTGRGSLVSRYAFASPDAGTGQDLGLTLNGLFPVYYNSDAEAVPSGGTQTAEANPEFRLSWAKQLQGMPIKLTTLIDANSDRYARSNGADGDVTYGEFRAQYVTGNNDQEFEPFVNYGPKSAFSQPSRTPQLQRTTLRSASIKLSISTTCSAASAATAHFNKRRHLGYHSVVSRLHRRVKPPADEWRTGFDHRHRIAVRHLQPHQLAECQLVRCAVECQPRHRHKPALV